MATPNDNIETQPAPRPGVRALVSLLIVLHLTAVFWGPFAMPPQASELAGSGATVLRPYVDGVGLANGYRFFAPEPGPSHLLRYELTFDDGSTQEGFFPNRDEQRPRLLYHRYFMMSEFLNTLSGQGAPRERADAYAKSYADHLTSSTGAKSVKLFLRRHYVPRMPEVRAGMQLSDKSLYDEQAVGTFEREAS